jgi:5-methylcytosine-specific restriction endonuclease McrA
MKLTIELVPSTCWYSNVRSEVSKERWDEIRHACYNKAGHKCEVCGDVGKNQGYNHDVECHEIWEYDDKKHIQRLIGFIALCPKCHQVKHLGHSRIKGLYNTAIKHLRKVNGFSKKQCDKYIDEVYAKYFERSKHNWKLDLSHMENYGKPADLNEMMKQFNKK